VKRVGIRRGRWRSLLLLVPLWLVAATLPQPLQAQDAAELKARLARERDPIKRARLHLRLAESLFNAADHKYQDGESADGLAALQQMLASVEDAHRLLFGTGRDPRKKPKGFKEAEIKLREFSRRLEDLRLSLPVDERPEVQKIEARLHKLHEDLLNGIMRVKRK